MIDYRNVRMDNEKALLLWDVVKAAVMLLCVCSTILFSLEVLFDVDIFSIKRVVALAVLCEAVYELRSVV